MLGRLCILCGVVYTFEDILYMYSDLDRLFFVYALMYVAMFKLTYHCCFFVQILLVGILLAAFVCPLSLPSFLGSSRNGSSRDAYRWRVCCNEHGSIGGS